MNPTDLVYRNGNGVPVTTSMIISEYFGKTHKDVMEAVKNILVSAEKSAETENQEIITYFELSNYETPLNNGTGAVRKTPMYIMNEEGFTLLAMGFTGEKARLFKIRYIKAFKAMRNVIQNQMDGTAQLMQAQQMITQNLLLLSQQMETMTRTNSLILERLERLESRPQDKPKGQRGKQLIKVRPSSPGYITRRAGAATIAVQVSACHELHQQRRMLLQPSDPGMVARRVDVVLQFGYPSGGG